ncbi:MAG TPA: MlaD family protein [Terriglobia bacterium]|nr:MlaD family protein [Terriglobia bacterium]
MPQRKEVQWAQLRVGITVTVCLIILVIGVFLVSGQIGFITRKYTLRAYFATAELLRPGSQVDLAGIPVGTVKSVGISDSQDPNRAVEIVLQVARTYQDEIRQDSTVEETTQGLLGETFLEITRGSKNQPVIADHGEIKAFQEPDIKQVMQNANDVVSNLNVLSSRLNDMANEITQGKGSIGKLLYDESLYNELHATAKSAHDIVAGIQEGNGTIGKFMADPTIYNKTVDTLNRLNAFLDQAQNGQGTLGRLMSDPALYNELKDLSAKLNTTVDNVNKGQGTLGKLVTDKELYDHMNSTMTHVDSLTARMDQGTGTLGKLSTDDTLYKNLSASSESLRAFLVEFRKNPRKYLQIRVHIF